METLKRHGGWKSSSVTEGYVADFLASKRKIGKLIQTSLNQSTDSSKDYESEATKEKRLK